MPKATPTRNQLESAIPLIYHEMGQIFAYWVWWTQVRDAVLPSFPEKSMQYQVVQNSVVVNSVLALRKLNEFFKDRPAANDEREDDLRAYDYPGFSGTGPVIHQDDFREIHKRVGHMTYREVDCGKASYELYDAAVKVLPRCMEFLDYVRTIFHSGQPERIKEMETVQKALPLFGFTGNRQSAHQVARTNYVWFSKVNRSTGKGPARLVPPG